MDVKEGVITLVKKLAQSYKTISCMESCTGGGLSNEITNIDGASEIFKFAAITYCNKYKIKMGVSKHIIDMYGVYSIEVAREMAKSISNFTSSDYGIGITGKLNCADKENPCANNDTVYVSIYDNDNNIFLDSEVKVHSQDRRENKNKVILKIIGILLKHTEKKDE